LGKRIQGKKNKRKEKSIKKGKKNKDYGIGRAEFFSTSFSG
jgi:hypothetical protein